MTPPVAPAAALTPLELSVIDVFERNSYSVVNIFDITIQVRAPTEMRGMGRDVYTIATGMQHGCNGDGTRW